MSKTAFGRLAAIVVCLAIGALCLAACGGSGSGSSASGGSGSRTISSPKELNIASFHGGSNNSYLQANIRAAKETARKVGAKIHVFDASFDVTQMANQVQSAMTSGRYNAFIIGALDPNQICGAIKQAIAQHIVVVVQNQGLCGNQTWTPGTLTFVGGQTLDVYNKFVSYDLDHIKSGKIAVITGPDLNYNTNNMEAALQTQVAKHPDIKVVANQQLDYTTEGGYKATQDILQAHRDLTAIISNYSGMTQGAVQAIKQAGLSGKVKVYDLGGNKWACDAVRAGDIEVTVPLLPYHELQRSVRALADYASGKPVKHYYNLTEELHFPGAPFVTKQNVSQFKPEYE